MNKQEWMDIYATHVVDNSDASRDDAEGMAAERAEVMENEHGIDVDRWDHPHDAALADMEDWDRSGDEDE